MSKAISEYITQKVNERITSGNFRQLKLSDGLIDFYSNDYLGFARNSVIADQANALLAQFTTHNSNSALINGSSGSRLLSGNSKLAEETEQMLAQFHDAEAALIFNSGYDANVGVLSSLPYKNATIFYDELVHASMHDGIRMSKANRVSFQHNNLIELEERLRCASGLKFIAIEALYSMDGDESPLNEVVRLAKKYDAAIILDEAHSNGIIGTMGGGKAQHEQLHKAVFIRIHTFGKAIGAHGAVVLCNRATKDFMLNYSRSFIYTTALPPHALATIRGAYDYLPNAQKERNQLAKNIALFKSQIADKNVKLLDSNSPIQCVIIEGNERIKNVAQKVQQQGFDVRAILSPTVPVGLERIRICLHSFNSKEEVIGLVDCIQSALS